jgi:hypothetical protein
MVERKAEEGRSDGVGFDMVQSGETRDKKGDARGAMVLDAEVVNYQDKGDGARVVTRRRLDSLPASLRPYIVFSMRKIMYGFPALSCLRKGID